MLPSLPSFTACCFYMASGLFSCQAGLLSLLEASQSLDAPPNALALMVTGDSWLPCLSYVRAALSVATALASCAFGLLCVWLARVPDDGLPDGVPDDYLATTRKRPRPSCDDKSPPWPVATAPATMHAARAVGAGLSCGAAAIGSSATATPAATRPATVTSLSSTTATASASPSAILLHRQLPRLPLPAGVCRRPPCPPSAGSPSSVHASRCNPMYPGCHLVYPGYRPYIQAATPCIKAHTSRLTASSRSHPPRPSGSRARTAICCTCSALLWRAPPPRPLTSTPPPDPYPQPPTPNLLPTLALMFTRTPPKF